MNQLSFPLPLLLVLAHLERTFYAHKKPTISISFQFQKEKENSLFYCLEVGGYTFSLSLTHPPANAKKCAPLQLLSASMKSFSIALPALLLFTARELASTTLSSPFKPVMSVRQPSHACGALLVQEDEVNPQSFVQIALRFFTPRRHVIITMQSPFLLLAGKNSKMLKQRNHLILRQRQPLLQEQRRLLL